MSNDAQLLISNQVGYPETQWDAKTKEDYVNLPILESEYTVPIFWLALFGPKNIERYIDPEDEFDMPYLAASVSDAKARFERNLSELRKVFKNVDSFLPEWQKILDGIKKKYIKVELHQILEMTEDGYGLLEPALRFLDNPDEESSLAFMRLTAFPDVFDQESQSILDRTLESGRKTSDYLFGFDPWQ